MLTRPPELREEVAPTLPDDLSDRLLQGQIVVQLEVDAEGRVTSVELVSGLSPELDDAALLAARQLRFVPAQVDGRDAAVSIEYRFVFDLEPEPSVDSPPVASRIEGLVGSAATGLPLEGVSIAIASADLSARSDSEGRFELESTPPGELRVVVFHPDFERIVRSVSLQPGEAAELEIFLSPLQQTSGETVVTGRRAWREVQRAPLAPEPSAVAGRWELTRRDLELTPGAMGDVAKVVGQLPGVVADTDMFAMFHVRGGAADETAFALDDIILLHPNHLGGTFTMFNPKLVDRVQLHASAPPAPWTESLSGTLDVHYIDGDPDQVDGIFDVNMAMGSLHFSGPLGRRGGPVTFLVSARRSFFEAYFALLRAVGLFSDQFVGMAFGDYLVRVTASSPEGRHRLRVTGLHTHDNMELNGEPGEGGLFTLEQGLSTRTRTTLVSADWRFSLAERIAWRNLVYFTHDYEDRLQDADFEVSRRVTTHRPGLRSDLELEVQDEHFVRAGVDLAYLSFGGDGTIKDPRTNPTWAALPWADLGASSLSFQSNQAWTELAVYLEDDWRGIFGLPIHARSGLRVTPAHATGEVLVSPRMALAVPLPTATTFKASWALVHQPLRDPLYLDPGIGADELRASRALHLSTGVEQLLPFGALIRIEAYHKVLDRLLVNPDSAAGLREGPSYASIGTGTASGVDAFVALRKGRVSLAATYSLLVSERTNPLNRAGPQTFAPAWDQRHGFRLLGEVKLGRKRDWILSGMWELRSGRPRTPVTPQLDADGEGWHVVPHDYNSASYGPWTELSVRFEHSRILKDRVKLSVYIDILNLTYAQGQFVWIYGAGSAPPDGVATPPEPSVFPQLPIRPWVGIRAEF